MSFRANAQRDRRVPLVGAAQTHKGLVRGNNEDNFVFDLDRGRFAVIDGMGGQRAGEVAARLARDWLLRREDLAAAIFEANREIFTRSADNAHERGMGCVVTAVQVRNRRLELAHVGDTRAYLARESGCRLLTRDHTTANDRQQQFALSDAAARSLPGQHQVTRDVGGASQRDTSWVVTGEEPFEPGDLLLLCSDGLHDLVSSDELYALLRKARQAGEDPPHLVRRLVQLALERGGKDNVTVVAVRREPDPRQPWRLPVVPRLRPAVAVAVCAALPVAGAFAYELGKRYLSEPEPSVPQLECLSGSRGLVEASLHPSLIWAGDAGLDGRLQPGVYVPLGPLDAAGGERATVIASATPDRLGPAVVVRGLDLRFPPDGRHVWRIRVEPGALLELTQASIRAPNLDLEVTLEGPRSALRVVDSHLDIGRLKLVGATEDGGRLWVRGGHFGLGEGGRVLSTNPGPLELRPPFDSANEEGS